MKVVKEENICPTTNLSLPVSTSSWAKSKMLKTTWGHTQYDLLLYIFSKWLFNRDENNKK